MVHRHPLDLSRRHRQRQKQKQKLFQNPSTPCLGRGGYTSFDRAPFRASTVQRRYVLCEYVGCWGKQRKQLIEDHSTARESGPGIVVSSAAVLSLPTYSVHEPHQVKRLPERFPGCSLPQNGLENAIENCSAETTNLSGSRRSRCPFCWHVLTDNASSTREVCPLPGKTTKTVKQRQKAKTPGPSRGRSCRPRINIDDG